MTLSLPYIAPLIYFKASYKDAYKKRAPLAIDLLLHHRGKLIVLLANIAEDLTDKRFDEFSHPTMPNTNLFTTVRRGN